MSENIFQILLLLSYLNIALISVTIAVYSISVSYLGRETSRSILRKRRREDELKETVKKLSQRLKDKKEIYAIEREIETVRNDIAFYKRQQKSLRRNLFWLSIKGAVLVPNVFFSLSLLASVIGILEVLQPEILLALSSILVVIGGLCLGKALMATERASLEVPQPKFDVFFKTSELKTRQCKVKVPIRIRPVIQNIGDESADHVIAVACFPKEIEVKKAYGDFMMLSFLDKDRRKFKNCWSSTTDVVNIEGYVVFAGFDIVAKQTGAYKILFDIKHKTGRSMHELDLRVDRKTKIS